MLTKAQVLEEIKAGRESNCFDARDYARLTEFLEPSEYPIVGFELNAGDNPGKMLDWTEAEIKKKLESDVNFGFDKALNKRGLSAGLMFAVVNMWLWILEDPIADHDGLNYAQYGLPLFKAVAIKYGFKNRIGDHTGKESLYET